MITAWDARDMARKANDTVNKAKFDALHEKILVDIASEADTGHRGTYFDRREFGDTTGIEFVIDELRKNGFDVDVERSYPYHRFESMYVSW